MCSSPRPSFPCFGVFLFFSPKDFLFYVFPFFSRDFRSSVGTMTQRTFLKRLSLSLNQKQGKEGRVWAICPYDTNG